MRKIGAILLALWLGGCAELQTLGAIAGTTVSPQAIVIAADTFDALEGTAANYANYCRPRLVEPACSADNRRMVFRAVRAGRAARNSLEVYIDKGVSAPRATYDILITSIETIQRSPAKDVGK